jgi:two-component system KDP operon response regulator KdpE
MSATGRPDRELAAKRDSVEGRLASEEAPTVLVVEDEPQIRRFVRESLEREGMRVAEASNAVNGLAAAAQSAPAAIVLDLGLPDRDGLAFIRDLRLWSKTPIVVLSARSAERDKVDALDAGADDYLTKPFGIAELLARVRAALRRAEQATAHGAPVFRFGEISVDHLRHRIERAGEEIHLTPIEYRLLALFIANAGRVLTHRQILFEVWSAVTAESSAYLRVHVGNLRRKIEADPARPRHILTETGVGYRFAP